MIPIYMITNEYMEYCGKILRLVDINSIAPNSKLEGLLESYIYSNNPEEKLSLQKQAEGILAGEQKYLDGFIDLVMTFYLPGANDPQLYIQRNDLLGKDGRPRPNGATYASGDFNLVSISADRKTFDSLSSKVRKVLTMTDAKLEKMIGISPVYGQTLYNPITVIKDHLRVRLVVPDKDVAAIDGVVNDIYQLPSLAERRGGIFIPSARNEIKDYTKYPKTSGYGKHGVTHLPVFFSPDKSPPRMIEVQVMTEESMYREVLDGYHSNFKPGILAS